MTMEKRGYQPTEEEIKKGEKMLTDEQKRDLEETNLYLPASWIEKSRGKSFAEIEALRLIAQEECCEILRERYEEYGDMEGAFQVSGAYFDPELSNDLRKEAEKILKDWKPTEEEIKFFVEHYYWGPRADLSDNIDVEYGKDFFHDFVGNGAKYIEKIQEFIEEVQKMNPRQNSSETDKDTPAQVRGKIADLEFRLIGPAIARMTGMNTVWREGIKEVNQNDNEQTFRAITTLLAFTGKLGKFQREIEFLRKNIQKVYPEAKI